MPPSGKTEVYVKLRVEKDFALDDSDEVIAFSLYVYILQGQPNTRFLLATFQILKLNVMIYNRWRDERLSMVSMPECWQNASDIGTICSSPEKYMGLSHKAVGPMLKVSSQSCSIHSLYDYLIAPLTCRTLSGFRSWLFLV